MKRIITKDIGKIIYEEVEEPSLKDGQALIKVKSVGLCNSDIAPYVGRRLDEMPLPFVMGHEFGGIIEEIKGKSATFKAGDKVAVYPQLNCGTCYYCRNNVERMCINQSMYGSPKKSGGLAEKIAVPLKNLVKMPDTFDIRYAGIIEPATVALHAVSGFCDAYVIVVGVGAIGAMMGMILKYNRCKFIAMDINDLALKKAVQNGADLAVNVDDANKTEKIKDFLKESPVDAVVLAHLDKSNWEFALEIVKKEGTIIEIAETSKFEVDFLKVLFKGLTIKGSACYNYDEFSNAASLVEKKIIDPEKIVTKFFSFDQASEAFEFKANNFALKVIILN